MASRTVHTFTEPRKTLPKFTKTKSNFKMKLKMKQYKCI